MTQAQIRVALAFIVGLLIVAGAFVLGMQKNTAAAVLNVASVTSAPRGHIAVTDSNGNGIPDWQESLITTDVILINQATSTYEKPTTVTGKFGVDFLEEMLRAKSLDVFGATNDELVAEATTNLAKEAIDALLTEADVFVIEETNPEILKSYGNHVASILLSQSSGSENEVIILQDSLRYGNKERVKDIAPITASYVAIVNSIMQTPVPRTYLKEHLDLLNALNAVKEDVRSMEKMYNDPMYTFIRLKRYEDDVLGMAYAVGNLFNALYLKDNIGFEKSDPASILLGLVPTT